MKERKKKITIFLILFIGFKQALGVMSFVEGYSQYLYNFETDADCYYIDGIIKINATYEMWYDPMNEEMYFQVQIYNATNNMIWNTSRYLEAGYYEKNWSINISSLTLPNETPTNLSVRFFVHWHHIITKESSDIFLREKQIQIIKKQVSCQLIDFNEHIYSFEYLNFKARFYDDLTGNSNNLINQTVWFKIEKNGDEIFNCNYHINSSGIIGIKINNSTFLKIGQNKLIFEIINNKFYIDSVFCYDLFIEKNPIEEKSSHSESLWYLNFFSFFSIMVIALIIIGTFLKIVKSVKKRNLSEITIRY